MTIVPAIRARIDATLADLESRENIRILWAVESGSRAWGFPSPDSDYDVRFVYVRPLEWYLSLNPGRDVIELPIIDELDVAGWDLRKALGLLVKSNPALLEWLSSPIVYRATPEAEGIRALARHSPYRRSAAHHYLALLRSNYDRSIANRPMVRLKKYMYCLRPALALLWLRSRDDMVPSRIAQDITAAVFGFQGLQPSSIDISDDQFITDTRLHGADPAAIGVTQNLAAAHVVLDGAGAPAHGIPTDCPSTSGWGCAG